MPPTPGSPRSAGPAPRGGARPATPAPTAGAPATRSSLDALMLEPAVLRAMADARDIQLGNTPPVRPATPVSPPPAPAPVPTVSVTPPATPSSKIRWGRILFLVLLILGMSVGIYAFGHTSGAQGINARVTVGSTPIITVAQPDLTSELKASKLEAENLKLEMDTLKANHREAIADVRSQLRAKALELDVALSDLSTAQLSSNTRMVTAALLQRDQAIEARNVALADVIAITSQMSDLADVHSSTVSRLQRENEAALSSMESRLNQAKARELAAKDATIAQLQRIVQSQRLDIQNLQFAAQGSTVAANGLTNVEILAPAIPARDRFSVRFVQQRELNFEVVVNNSNLETQSVVQVPPGLYTVTRMVNGQPYGNPVETLIWPGAHRSWFQFANNGVWHTVERNNPFIAFWNGVGERRSTLPNGQIRLVNGDMVTVENGRVVTNK